MSVNEDEAFLASIDTKQLKYLELPGMQDFDLDQLENLGLHRFKLLRARDGNLTGVCTSRSVHTGVVL